MDTNGTHFHLLFGYENWSSCIGDDGLTLRSHWENSPAEETEAHWDSRNGDLTLRPQSFRFKASRGDRAPQISDRRGAAQDVFGNWYWISGDRLSVRVLSTGSSQVTDFWPVAQNCRDAQEGGSDFREVEAEAATNPCVFSGLTITEDHFLVVGVLPDSSTGARLLFFDLHAGGAPVTRVWPPSVPFSPFDFTPRRGGGLWMLDRDNRRLWGMNRTFQFLNASLTAVSAPESEDFVDPTQTSAPPTGPETLSVVPALSLSCALVETDPISVESLPDGSLLILDHTTPSTVSRYRDFARAPATVSLALLTAAVQTVDGAPFVALGHDLAFETTSRRVFIVTDDGNQVFCFDYRAVDSLAFALDPVPAYFPLRLFSGKALVQGIDGLHYDLDERWLPVVEQARPRFVTEAHLRSYPLDSDLPDCVWHRVMLDAVLGVETGILVESRAANSLDELALSAWSVEPSPYTRGGGNELPFVPGQQLRPTRELLLQQARGRYLQLRLTLTGNGRATPRLRAVRVYYPRFSYLSRYLPAFYRDDSASASFLDRFLANAEGIATSTEDRIAAVHLLFDARSTPAEALDWLASWFGVVIDGNWSPEKKRFFLKNAMTLFQWRGTAHGLRIALRLVFDACLDESLFTDVRAETSAAKRFRIVERFRTRSTPGVLLGDATSGPQQVAAGDRWQPAQGAEVLHARYRSFLGTNNPALRYPLSPPANPQEALLWERFSRSTLGFVPGTYAEPAGVWEAFLRRRYLAPSRLPAAYGPSVTSFSATSRPSTLPGDKDLLRDWYLFESIVLATVDSAHRFRVLLPLDATASRDPSLRTRQLQLASRIIELEKPAHTQFDVRFYWALFRLGEARLGEDTQLGAGSRAPELLPGSTLGEAALAESVLYPSHPYNVRNRLVLGRDRILH